MIRILGFAALVAMCFGAANSAVALQGKAPKADTVIKDGEMSGKVKAGGTVDIQTQHAVAPPFPEDFEATVDGWKLDTKVIDGAVVGPNGTPIVGVGLKIVEFKAGKPGKYKVVLSYKKGKEQVKREIELEVTE